MEPDPSPRDRLSIQVDRRSAYALVLTGLRDRVARVFSLTGLDRRICVRPDPDSALHWLETGRRDRDEAG